MSMDHAIADAASGPALSLLCLHGKLIPLCDAFSIDVESGLNTEPGVLFVIFVKCLRWIALLICERDKIAGL